MLLILLLQNKGFRYLEAFVIALVVDDRRLFRGRALHGPAGHGRDRCAAWCRATEIVTNPAMLYIAIGILGATVMPHNLYLH